MTGFRFSIWFNVMKICKTKCYDFNSINININIDFIHNDVTVFVILFFECFFPLLILVHIVCSVVDLFTSRNLNIYDFLFGF